MPFWPTWGEGDGDQLLAQFVSPATTLPRASLDIIPSQRIGGDGAAADLAVARTSFDELSARGIAAALDPWIPLTTQQQIRDPEWLIANGVGNCLDLTLTHAAMCLQAGAAPHIAVGHGHAFLLLRLGARSDPDWPDIDPLPLWGASGREQADFGGVYRIDDPASVLSGIEAGELVAIESLAVTDSAVTFEEATRRGSELIRRGVRLVDVGWLQREGGVAPLDRPEDHAGTGPYVPGGRAESVSYPSRTTVVGDILELTGIVAIYGEQGSGKSTIARGLAAGAPHAAGWFLDASSRQTLINSLAQAELAELNRPGEGLSDQEREGYAYAALSRLQRATHPWTVVFDNANGDPLEIRSLVPEPKDGQLLVVTTTEPRWRKLAHPIDLDRLDEADVEARVGAGLSHELSELINGRPLMLEAFRSFSEESGVSLAAVKAPEAEGDLPEAVRGPAALWDAVRSILAEGERSLALRAAYLPPDYLPAALLERLSGTPEGTVERLASLGLLGLEPRTRTATLHRLFGAAIRRDEAADPAEIAAQLCSDPEVLDLLDRRGDAETIERLAESVKSAASSGLDGLAVGLHGLASVLELKGNTPASAALYELAQPRLEATGEDNVLLVVDCLHGRARLINQQHADDGLLLKRALEWVEEARSLCEREGHAERLGRPLAMKGLLEQKVAKLEPNREQRLRLLQQAQETLREADRLRVEFIDEADPERLRSYFNLAGSAIELARADPSRAAEHLDVAAEVYETVAQGRVEIYGRHHHPHIAACLYGLSVVNYFRATLLDVDAEQRTEWLRLAAEVGDRALAQRQAFDGSRDLLDTDKSLKMQAKIALARWSVPARHSGELTSFEAELSGELKRAGIILDPVPRLEAGRDAGGFIEDWTYSKAMTALVSAFGGRGPSADAGVLATLEDLDRFSQKAWDTRAGRERNEARVLAATPYQERVVRAAAIALGLDDVAPPSLATYDHVLILGGLARGCIARPLAVAELLAERIQTKRVTALAAFRETNAGEVQTLARVGLGPTESEFESMDVGVRRAFGLDAPDAVEEGVTEVGAPWRIHRYDSPAAPIDVVAVPRPSADPNERVRTGDSYRWLLDAGILEQGDSVLVVTTAIYRVYQLADAIRELGRGFDVDALGMRPGDVEPELLWPDPLRATTQYLLEVRSTIRALHALQAAIASY